ncbi:MAG TPA: hypothetical protein VEC60_16295 [Reyranella sp.]|nr:hypothetical protein [Reyranella sp.]
MLVRWWGPALAVAAAILLAPSLLGGTLISHSSPQNLTWAGQFAELFRAGVLYPRWLPASFEGLGSPAFYFYPPIAFWIDALLSVATLDALSVSYRLSFSSLILLWASGAAMYVWLRAETTSARVALLGALAYVAAPYHLLDHYYRGAYAEFAAYAVLPLLALAVRWTADGRRFGPILLALSYAALPMSHLPTALLISLTMLPMYVLYRGWRLGTARPAAAFFARSAVAGALGLGLASIYLLPALTLQDWIPSDTFWGGYYAIDRWFLLTPWRWFEPLDMMTIIASAAAAYAVAAVGVLVAVSRNPSSPLLRSEAAFWAIACLVCVALIAGVVPWFWQLPFVAKVQFPWRLMIVVEFAGITMLCLMPWPVRSRAAFYVLVVALVALIPGLVQMGAGIRQRAVASSTVSEVPLDLKQFLPARYPQKPDGSYAELSLEPVQDLPKISCMPPARLCRATDQALGELLVEIDTEGQTAVTLRRFAFPYWRLEPALSIAATEPLQLVSFTAPSGSHSYRLRHAAVAAEKIGWTLSAGSLVLLLAWAVAQATRLRGSERRLFAAPP